MFVHPLARTDQHLIQDFMLTKVALLLARHAERKEWVFEMEAMDEKSLAGSSRGHAFLFIYTVARYHAAVIRAHAETRGEADAPTDDTSTFFGDFNAAVAANEPRRALSLWFTSPFSTETAVSAPSIQRVAFEFLEHLDVPASELTASNVADFLPDPYIPETPVNEP